MAKLYTVNELAELFKVDIETIYRRLRSGDIKGFRFGKQWRFTQEEIDRLLTGQPKES